eukprot:CAMPEP_0177354954 /NCGR_PEP_ID=MMETSP0368-20130122/33706_1 /TAXON_ID=447022 ORGANISM="Scrippsiella hangoei-like, Strain SHHI-4" /NCGR_SAMPLE_ID=MMETSP0368 /ASSEMBLY_ACC=CAM_ASM_000363 /LENGTH=264 /DNA_ID=CAMNT_0018817131 /DNA_START=13 /DNA_END=805 /DNA_ORIENTATION=-
MATGLLWGLRTLSLRECSAALRGDAVRSPIFGGWVGPGYSVGALEAPGPCSVGRPPRSIVGRVQGRRLALGPERAAGLGLEPAAAAAPLGALRGAGLGGDLPRHPRKRQAVRVPLAVWCRAQRLHQGQRQRAAQQCRGGVGPAVPEQRPQIQRLQAAATGADAEDAWREQVRGPGAHCQEELGPARPAGAAATALAARRRPCIEAAVASHLAGASGPARRDAERPGLTSGAGACWCLRGITCGLLILASSCAMTPKVVVFLQPP